MDDLFKENQELQTKVEKQLEDINKALDEILKIMKGIDE